MAEREFKPLNYTENQIDEKLVRDTLGGKIVDFTYESAQPVLTIKREDIVDVARLLRDTAGLTYNFFVDITAADLSQTDDFDPDQRFQVIVVLYSTDNKRRIRLKVFVPEDDCRCPSLTSVFDGASITEREAFEMFGVKFEGHPNLKRLLTPEYMKYYPLRKEYPTTGRGERDNFPQYEEIQ